jgi:hypothetical protein
VNEAISAAIKHHGYVSAIDVFLGMQLLTPEKVEAWRKGQVPYLERVIVAGLGTVSRAMIFFRKQAATGGLAPRETAYLARGLSKRPLRFSKSGNPNIERAYRTHYVAKVLIEKSRARKTERRSRAEPCRAPGDSARFSEDLRPVATTGRESRAIIPELQENERPRNSSEKNLNDKPQSKLARFLQTAIPTECSAACTIALPQPFSDRTLERR